MAVIYSCCSGSIETIFAINSLVTCKTFHGTAGQKLLTKSSHVIIFNACKETLLGV